MTTVTVSGPDGGRFQFGIDAYISDVDGTLVVHIDTGEDASPDGYPVPEDSAGPRIRVYLNDGTLWEAPDDGPQS